MGTNKVSFVRHMTAQLALQTTQYILFFRLNFIENNVDFECPNITKSCSGALTALGVGYKCDT